MENSISLVEFFEVVQKEYIVAELRSRIFPSEKDKNFWRKVMKDKEKKILDISDRNSLPNIIEDRETRKDFYKRVCGEYGYPNFIYKDDEQRLGSGFHPGLEELDFTYYYNLNAEVKMGDNKLFKIGRIVEVLQDGIKIYFEEEEKELFLSNEKAKKIVTRIL